MLDRLGELEANEVLVEAGATLAGEWLRGNLADEVLLYVAPKLLGLDARGLVDVPALKDLKDALTFALLESQPVGADLRLRLAPAAATPRQSAPCVHGNHPDVGRIESCEARGGDVRLVVGFENLDPARLQIGDSISVQGCCPTATEISGRAFAADVVARDAGAYHPRGPNGGRARESRAGAACR